MQLRRCDYDCAFAHKFLSKGDRTIDQMIQSARSGKQNILEGSKAGTTSKETEVKLTNIGRASLEELLADYRDYLRVRDLKIWDRDSKEAAFVRRRRTQDAAVVRAVSGVRGHSFGRCHLQHCDVSDSPNELLLNQQSKAMERELLEHGGLRERMTRPASNTETNNTRSDRLINAVQVGGLVSVVPLHYSDSLLLIKITACIVNIYIYVALNL